MAAAVPPTKSGDQEGAERPPLSIMPEFSVTRKFVDEPEYEQIIEFANEFSIPSDDAIVSIMYLSIPDAWEVKLIWQEEIPDGLQ